MANQKHTSFSNEHNTPSYLVGAARRTLDGHIDLDPASNEFANRTVRASTYHSYVPKRTLVHFDARGTLHVVEEPPQGVDGLTVKWFGNVFLNPPGGLTADGRSSAVVWFEKLCNEIAEHRVLKAIFVAFSLEFLQSVQNSSTLNSWKICILKKRVQYIRPDGKPGDAPPGGSAILYYGPNSLEFRHSFQEHGIILEKAGP